MASMFEVDLDLQRDRVARYNERTLRRAYHLTEGRSEHSPWSMSLIVRIWHLFAHSDIDRSHAVKQRVHLDNKG